jgi:hypothetical protein
MYVDESGVADISDNSNYFVTAGIIFHENDLNAMKSEIQNYKNTYFTGNLANAEIHVYDIWRGKGSFFGLDLTQKIALLDPLYKTVNNLHITNIAIRIDKKKFVTRHPINKILDYGYMLLVERFDNFLRDNESNGIIRIDRSTKSSHGYLDHKDSTILKIVNRVRKRGTQWQRAAIDIVEEPTFLHSHTRKGLQIADTIAYCTTRKSNNHSDFDSYWNLIYPKFRKSATGITDGYGLVTYPK